MTDKIKPLKIKIKMPDFKKCTQNCVAIFGNLWSNRGRLKFVKVKTDFETPRLVKIILASLILLVFSVLVFFGVMIYGIKSQDKITQTVAHYIPYPVAVVNYDFVTYFDYTNETDYIHHFYSSTKQDASVNMSDVDKQILDQLIENKIVSEQARKYKIKVTKADEDQVVNGIIDQNGGQDKVEKVLNDMYGINLNRFRKLVDVQLMRDQLNQKVIERVGVQHILIKVDQNAAQADVDAAKKKIDDIKTQIVAGMDFGDAAKKYSEDSATASSSGTLDAFTAGEMVPEFEKVAFNIKVGDISDPVRTQYGWHLIKVNSKTGIVQVSFADWLSALR
ncbi:MAG: peptidylprolyl isomerase [Candidatus Berkelbacteria bacterium]|nr:peptidylprolyl isomerase [Candidatus Berkelbacteria bacterium]